MELIRDILDKQVVDREETKMGKVDAIIAELRAGEPPRVTFVEIGSSALARRLGPRLGRLASRIGERLGGEKHREPYRIPWSKLKVGLNTVRADVEAEKTQALEWELWLRKKVIGKIPGA